MADWDKLSGSGNVDDRRMYGPVMGGIGSFGAMGIVALVVANLLGVDPGLTSDIMNQLAQSQAQRQTTGPSEFDGKDSYEAFTSKVLGSTNDTWTGIFEQSGTAYREPRLVLFRGATASGCGGATSSSGPHYCPADETIYLDETFFDELTKQLGAKGGDVAQAYVIAHEVGHHVQQQLDLLNETERARDAEAARAVSIKLELQADCFAGVWLYAVNQQGILEPGEITEARDAAAAVGDDHIQQTTSGRVTPENWTHGSSAERTWWFNRGYQSGQPSQCQTF